MPSLRHRPGGQADDALDVPGQVGLVAEAGLGGDGGDR